jgi:hypothetical protein
MDRNSGQSAAKRLIYGGYRLHQSFAVLDETQAEGLAREIRAVQACTTEGQARKLASKLQFTWVPDIDVDEEDDEQLPDDAPYDWSKTGAAVDGDWPPMPDQISLENLPADLRQELINKAGATVEFTTLNGDFLAIPLDREDDLVNVIRSAGYDVHRNDELIGIIGLNDDYVPGPEDQI